VRGVAIDQVAAVRHASQAGQLSNGGTAVSKEARARHHQAAQGGCVASAATLFDLKAAQGGIQLVAHGWHDNKERAIAGYAI
jgi:hypothetical protein